MAEPSSPLSSLRSSSPTQAIPTTPPQPRKYTDEELAAAFLGSDDSYRPTPKAQRRALTLKNAATKRLNTIAQEREVRRAQSATAYLPPLPALFSVQDPNGSTKPGASVLPAAADPVASSANSDSEAESPELAGDVDGSRTLGDDKNKWTYVASVADEVFAILDSRGVSWGTLVEYIADPSTKQGTRRWYGFFKSGPQVRRVLNYWLSSRNGGRHTLREWAVGYVSKLVDKEANSVTNSGLLKSRNKNVDSSFVLGFDLPQLYDQLQGLCPVMAGVIKAFCTTRRQTKSKNEHSKKKQRTRMLATFLDLLGQRSQQNSWSKHLFGLYLFATGTQRQTIAVLSSWGVCSSYSTLAGTQVSAISTDESSSRHTPVDSETNLEVAPTPTTSAITTDTPPAVGDFDNMEVDEEEAQGEDTVSESEASMSSDSNSDHDEPEFIELEYESGSDYDEHMSIDVPGEITPLHIGMVEDDWDDLGEPFPTRSEDEDMMVDSEEEVQGRRAALLAENDGISVSKQTTTHKPAISQDAINPSVTATLGRTHGKKTEGLVRRLSKACCHAAQQAAQSHDVAHVYDNINFMFKAAEQIVGRKDSQENGTCATAIRLINASLDDMRTADLVSNMKQASALDMKDVLLSQTEAAEYHSLLVHTIIRIIVAHGGSSFEKFQDDVNASLPVTAEQIPLHKTEYYPLPAMEIDESSVVGNADVVQAISESLAYDLESPEYLQTVRIYCGDQLSMARLRTVAHNRVGHDAPQQAHVNIVQVPGLFHAQMHVASSCLEAHWGLPGAGARDPGSLGFHNTIVDRKPIVLSSPPPYRTCRDLVFVSLYARILHCLELVSGIKVDDYAASTTFETLKGHAEEIYDRFANSEVVDDLRHGTPSLQEVDGEITLVYDNQDRDFVFENALLFNRDALIMREFNDAIKAGDSGRVLLSFKTLSAFYRGSGRTKYAYETLVTLHNTIHVWPAPLRRIVLQNWLVNTTGRANGFIPVDLLQERQNFWIKKIYAAQGSNASWEWLRTISPCINVLRELVSEFHEALGSHQGTKHAAADLSLDISEIMDSLAEHKVYERQRGRTNEDSKGNTNVVRDVLATGLAHLKSPLNDYNTQFGRLQRQWLLCPLIDEGSEVLQPPKMDNADSEDAGNDPTGPPPNSPIPTDSQLLSEDEYAMMESELVDGEGSGSESEQENSGDSEDEMYWEHEDIVYCTLEDEDDLDIDI